MSTPHKRRLTCVVAVLLLQLACEASSPSERFQRPGFEEVVDQFLSAGAQIAFVRRTSTGALHHVVLRVSGPQSLPRYRAVTADGSVVSWSKAEGDFLARHHAAFGRLSPESAAWITQEQPSSARFLVMVDRDEFTPETLSAVFPRFDVQWLEPLPWVEVVGDPHAIVDAFAYATGVDALQAFPVDSAPFPSAPPAGIPTSALTSRSDQQFLSEWGPRRRYQGRYDRIREPLRFRMSHLVELCRAGERPGPGPRSVPVRPSGDVSSADTEVLHVGFRLRDLWS